MGARIAQARRELAVRQHKDISKAMLAAAAGVDPSAITLYEGDKSNVGEEVLGRLADYLGVTPAWLRYGVKEAPGPVEPNPLLDQRISDEEIRAARAQVAARKRPAAKKANGRHHGRG